MRRIYLLLLVVTLASGCVKNPLPGEFDFIPILKGLKPVATQGELKTGRTDKFVLHIPFNDLRGEMRIEDFNLDEDATTYTFTPIVNPIGLAQCQISVRYDALEPDSKKTCHVTVWRSSAPPTVPKKTQKVRFGVNYPRELQIANRLKKGQDLSNSDGDFLLKAMEERVNGLEAGLLLGHAVQMKFFPRDRLLAQTESILDRSDQTEDAVWIAAYEMVLGLPSHTDQTITDEAIGIMNQKSPASSFTQGEQSFADRVLQSSRTQNSDMAAMVLVAKRDLSSADRSWVLDRVQNQIQKSKGKEKMYWECVRRVVLFRNPAANH